MEFEGITGNSRKRFCIFADLGGNPAKGHRTRGETERLAGFRRGLINLTSFEEFVGTRNARRKLCAMGYLRGA